MYFRSVRVGRWSIKDVFKFVLIFVGYEVR